MTQARLAILTVMWVLEKNLTLEITYKVKENLENAGYTVSMTRTGDTLPSLVERPTQANAENAAVFVMYTFQFR